MPAIIPQALRKTYCAIPRLRYAELARQPGLWRQFHGWSLPALLLSLLLALGLDRLF